jgi:uncharacterized repeat protein (TIGR03803 family)
MLPRNILLAFAAALLLPHTIAAQAPTSIFTTLAKFGYGNGQIPNAPLVQGTDGNFYGTTYRGGTDRRGVVFSLTSGGVTTNLFNFGSCDCGEGTLPAAGLILGADGNFYGDTSEGGDGVYANLNHGGVVFTIGPLTPYSTVYDFCSQLGCKDGDNPYLPLTLGSDGNLYGVTFSGGLHRVGNVFVLTPAGVENSLYSFSDADGGFGGLVQATDGYLYGGQYDGNYGPNCTTAYGCGSIFRISHHGDFSTIYTFCSQPNCTDGAEGGYMIQAADGNLYGIANIVYGTPGSIFKLTTSGEFTTLYTFCSLPNCADGRIPSRLIQGTDGNFYGATSEGGSGAPCYQSTYACGTLFELTSSGILTTLYNFCPDGGLTCTDGMNPGALVQGTDGNFYGVTSGPFPYGPGTAFKLSTGLAPFVQTVTSNGAVGASVIILGNNLTGATSVTFNGTSASFTVVSATEITATVPKGATTGAVEVITPSAALLSNKTFTVTN